MTDERLTPVGQELPVFFRQLAERIPGVMWVVDPDLRMSALFGAGLDQLDENPTEAIGKTLFEHFHTTDPNSSHIIQHRRALAGERVNYEDTVRGRHLEIHLEPVRDPSQKVIGCVGLAQDVTERKQAEAEARRRDQVDADRKLVRTLESIPEGVMIFDENHRFQYVSNAAARIWNTTPEHVIGKLVQDLFPKSLEILAMPEVERVRRERQPYHIAGYYPEPLNIFYECHCHPMPDGITLVYIRDVTQRQRAEEMLRREKQALWRMVQSSDHERRMITHDLHDGAAQELMAALMFFQTFEDQWNASPDDAKVSADAGIAALKRASAEVRRLINGVRTPVLDRLGLVAAIDDQCHQLRQLPGAPKIVFRRNVANLKLASVLENCLFRVAQELLTNAVKHSSSDIVRIRLKRLDGHLFLEVRDWGIGFDPKTVSDDQFGLDGVRERVRLLGGKLQLRSESGKGTCVRVVLPAVVQPDEE